MFFKPSLQNITPEGLYFLSAMFIWKIKKRMRVVFMSNFTMYKIDLLYSHNDNTSRNRRMQIQVGSVVQVRTVYKFLTSVLRHEERDKSLSQSYYANNTPNVQHIPRSPRSQFIPAGRGIKNSTVCLNGRNPNYTTPWSELKFLTPWSELNWIFFKNPPNTQPISSGHDIIHTPAPFPVWCLLWPWWLSYPLRASVNCTNWLHTWTRNPNSSKPNQTGW